MLAMVGVMTRVGRHPRPDGARSPAFREARVRRTQVATYLMGLVVFFDDYANTILVGSTMRPLTDRLQDRAREARVPGRQRRPRRWPASRSSAPGSPSRCPRSTPSCPAAGLMPWTDGYAVFMQTIPYSFYCIFTLVFVGVDRRSTGRDFGPMRTRRAARADDRARSFVKGRRRWSRDEATATWSRRQGHRPAQHLACRSCPLFASSLTGHAATPSGWMAAAPSTMGASELFSVQGMTVGALRRQRVVARCSMGALAGVARRDRGSGFAAGLGARDVARRRGTRSAR